MSALKEQHSDFSSAGAAACAVNGHVTMNRPKHIAAASSCFTSARTSEAYGLAVACQSSYARFETLVGSFAASQRATSPDLFCCVHAHVYTVRKTGVHRRFRYFAETLEVGRNG